MLCRCCRRMTEHVFSAHRFRSPVNYKRFSSYFVIKNNHHRCWTFSFILRSLVTAHEKLQHPSFSFVLIKTPDFITNKAKTLHLFTVSDFRECMKIDCASFLGVLCESHGGNRKENLFNFIWTRIYSSRAKLKH